jgi:hypothetical protein
VVEVRSLGGSPYVQLAEEHKDVAAEAEEHNCDAAEAGEHNFDTVEAEAVVQVGTYGLVPV